MIQALSVLQLQRTIHHFKALITDRVGHRVIGINVTRRQGADHRTRRVFSNRARAQRQIRRRFIHIRDGNREGLVRREIAAVRRRHNNIDRRRIFVIQALSVLQLQRTIHHFKALITDRVGHRVIGINVTRRQGADHRTRRVFSNRARAQRQIRRRFIHIRDGNREGLVRREIAAVRRRHNNIDRRRIFVIQALSVLQLQRTIHHFKALITDRVGHRVIGINVTRRQGADHRTRRVFSNRARAQRQIRRRFIHIRDGNREGLVRREIAAVRRRHNNIDRRRIFVIQALSVLQLQRTIHHFKALITDRVGHRVIGINVTRRQGADHRTRRVFSNRARAQRQIRRRIVNRINGDRNCLNGAFTAFTIRYCVRKTICTVVVFIRLKAVLSILREFRIKG